ncbi:MAG: lipopolysaccharide heptosyltransferase II [Methylococcales bacterium]|nr:lipopolysaccharide heptosyltransferase II [Methylococcales bacterium]
MKNSRILIVGASWIGDMVMAQSLFMTLKQQHPDCQIDVLAPKWTFALLDRMPEVSTAIEMPLGHGKLGLMERIQLGKRLRDQHYDQAILLPNSWKSALTPFFANIPLRTGYVGECRWGLLNDAYKLDKTQLTKTVQRFVALAYPKTATTRPICPVPSFKVSDDQQQRMQDKFNLNRQAKVLVLCTGAEFGRSKRWLGDYYAQVANHFLSENWQVWLLGSEKDKTTAAEVNQQTNNTCHDFTGSTSIADAVDLMSLATMVVANDSGLMHIAAGLNKNLIAIYGSSDPNFTPPLNENATVINLGLECSPCFKRVCPLEHTRCLTEIKPKQVIEAIHQKMQRTLE